MSVNMSGISGSGTSATSAPASGTSGAGAALSSAVPGGALNENSFLQLLVTQLENQNPLQPTANTQFIAQLAQFTSLEQMTNVATGVTQLGNQTQLGSSFSLLGDTVTVQDGSGGSVTGTVSSVSVKNGQATLTVNGQSYPFSAVTTVSK